MNSRTTRPPLRFETIDVRGLSDDVRRAILKRVKAKLGFNEALSALDISRGALSYYLRGLRKTPDEVVSKAPVALRREGVP